MNFDRALIYDQAKAYEGFKPRRKSMRDWNPTLAWQREQFERIKAAEFKKENL